MVVFGMFMAILDIQIVSASRKEIQATHEAADYFPLADLKRFAVDLAEGFRTNPSVCRAVLLPIH
jgi:hypothetical protein